LKWRKTPQAIHKMSNTVDPQDAQIFDAMLSKVAEGKETKNFSTIEEEREKEVREAIRHRSDSSVFTVWKDSSPAEKPTATQEPQWMDSNASHGVPLEVAYTLPLSQTVDIFVEALPPNGIAGFAQTLNKIAEVKTEVEPTAKQIVSAANDLNDTDKYTKFETDFLSELVSKVRYTVSSTKDGEKSYILLQHDMQSTLVLLFPVHDKMLIKVSNLLMPLDNFLSLTKCVEISKAKNVLSQTQLRGTQNVSYNSVGCTFGDGSTVEIVNMTVDLLSAVVEHVGKITKEVAPLPASPPPSPTPSESALPSSTPESTPPVSGAEETIAEPTCWERFVAVLTCRGRRGH